MSRAVPPEAPDAAKPRAASVERRRHPYRRAARIVAGSILTLVALYGLWILASFWYRGAQG